MRLATRLAAPAIALAVAVGLLAAPTLGVTAAGSGWWTTVPTLPAPIPAAPNPAAPGPGQLGVSATPAGATSVAAVRFTLSEGELPTGMDIEIAGGAGQQAAVVVACPASTAWSPASGGPMAEAPPAACDTHLSLAQLVGDTVLHFPLDAGFLTNGVLDLVILPGAVDANGQKVTPLFNLILTPPPAQSVAVSRTDSSSSSFSFDSSSTTTFDPAVTDDPTIGLGQSSALEAPPTTEFNAPADIPTSPPTSIIESTVTPAPGVALGPTRRTADDSSDRARNFGLLLFPLAVLGGIWALNTTTPGLRGIGRLARPVVPGDGTAPGEGGLARFRRDRTSPPVPLR
jgi:hypothetical protein